METTTAPALRVVSSDDPGTPLASDVAREEYWAQVQALREDLHRLRPAN